MPDGTIDTKVTLPAGAPAVEAKQQDNGIRLDLGCGPHKKEGTVGIDRIAFLGVDVVLDIGKEPLPYEDGTVAAIHTSHFVEHLTAVERIHCLNECWRVLKTGGQVTLIVPHWSSCRAYGDPTHQWPPIGEFWFMYLNKEWRATQAPHTDIAHWAEGYSCDFEATWGYALNPSPEISMRSQEAQTFAVNHYKEAIFDVQATLTRRG